MAAASDQVHCQQAAGRHRPAQMHQQSGVPCPRAEDVGLACQIDIIQHDVKAAAVVCEPRIGIGGDDFDVERVEVHVGAGEVDDFRVDIDGGELAVRQQVAQHAVGGAASQAQHQHRAWRARGAQQRGGGDEVPCQAC